MLIEKIIERKKSRISQWPCNSNRASEMGHPCERYLVFNRTRWQEKALHDVNLQFIFDEGNLHEASVLRDLQDAGVQIIEQQRAFSWPEYNITGHVDAKAVVDGKAIPLEIKSSSPYIFNSIETSQDLKIGKYTYLRKYPAQLTLYMLMDNKDEGLFIFKNKVNGQLKEIPMTLNYDYGEALIQKAERINRYVAEGETPEPIEWDEQICGDCPFAHICLPEAVRNGLEMMEDPELEVKLQRRDELKAAVAEYNALDKEIKKALEGVQKKIVGNYLITSKLCHRKGYIVQESDYWKINISRLDEKIRRSL